MSIMVTGGTGFIGNRIIRKLVERGEEVVCFDLAPPRANLEPYLDRVQLYRVALGEDHQRIDLEIAQMVAVVEVETGEPDDGADYFGDSILNYTWLSVLVPLLYWLWHASHV